MVLCSRAKNGKITRTRVSSEFYKLLKYEGLTLREFKDGKVKGIPIPFYLKNKEK
jgi:hypothetical protein